MKPISILFALCIPLYSGTCVASANGRLSFQVDLVLGSSQNDAEYIFGEVTSVVEDSEGKIYVADRSQSCVHKFASNGEYLGQLGKPGGGPGDIMPYFVVAIDSADNLYVAGQGERVEVVDTDWNYVASFSRRNPASRARAVAVFPDGRIAIAAPGQSTDTTVDLYSAKYSYVGSCSKSFSFDSGLPRHVEAPFVGGFVTVSSSGRLYFAQMTPFLVRAFSRSGAVIDSTTAGGDEFVGYPPVPLIDGASITYLTSPQVVGIVAIADGGVLISCVRYISADIFVSHHCAFDSGLGLLGCLEEDGLVGVVGGTGDGTVYIRSDDSDGKRVLRAQVRYVKP